MTFIDLVKREIVVLTRAAEKYEYDRGMDGHASCEDKSRRMQIAGLKRAMVLYYEANGVVYD